MQPLTAEDKRTELIMLRLRTTAGLDLCEYSRFTRRDLMKEKSDEIARLLRLGVITANDNEIKLTDKGFYVMDSVIEELL